MPSPARIRLAQRRGLPLAQAKRLAGLTTPRKIQDFLAKLPQNFEPDGDTARSVQAALAANCAHCIEGAMIAAFAVSTLFLISYLTYHWLVGHVPFAGQGPARIVYFAILLTHILLAVTVPVLAIAMFWLALKGRWEAHRRLGRITMPIWLYVSITGVVIYLMVYHLYPQPVGTHAALGRPAGAGIMEGVLDVGFISWRSHAPS